MATGLCHQCGPKKLTDPHQIKKLKLYLDAHTGKVIYLCVPCAKDLGYMEGRKQA